MIRNNKKAMEMSMAMIVAIVLGLIVIAIVSYSIYDKAKQGSAAGKCEALGGKCGTSCPPDGTEYKELKSRSITPCKTGLNPENKSLYDGFCCYPN